MHILIVHQAFVALDEAGGTRHYELARHLVGHGHQVTVIASPISYLTGKARARMKWVEKEQPEAGITILRTYTYSALHRSFVHRVFSFLSFMFSSFWVGLGVRKVDLVWGTSPPIFQGVSAWLLARLKGARFLFEVRDLWPAFAIDVGVLKNKLLIRLSLWLERFLYRRADQMMVNSPGYVEHVKERGAKRVALIPNGADTSMFNPQADGAEWKEKHGLTGRFVVLYAGAHGMSNDLGVVLDAASQTQEGEICYVFVGDGKEKAALQAQAVEEGLENVLFLPPVPKNEMSNVLAAADACIAILKPIEMYKTTYPNKVFDYMASGRPILLAIDGVVRQVVDAAGAGIFVPPGDSRALAEAAEELAGNPIAARQMGLDGRRYLETHFDRARLAEELQQLVESGEKMSEKILVVEDELTLQETLAYNLKRQGYEVFTAGDGLKALEIARLERPDLVILDIMLPGMDGFEICRNLRREMNTPVLMLTARDDEVDRVVGLEVGADDYQTKPFSMRELIARVKAMLRRVRLDREENQPAPGRESPLLRFDDLVLDLARREVCLQNHVLVLKPKEYDLLLYLAQHARQVLSRETILQDVWGWDYTGDSRTVDVHMRWLREKIETDPGNPNRLVTVRGAGYRFEG